MEDLIKSTLFFLDQNCENPQISIERKAGPDETLLVGETQKGFTDWENLYVLKTRISDDLCRYTYYYES